MRIALAQVASRPGDVAANLERHRRVLDRLNGRSVDLVMFPELSLTGYAPELATAIDPEDARLDPFQRFADATGSLVGVGIPTPGAARPRIAIVVFAPRSERRVVAKRYLHADELPFFEPADGPIGLLDTDPRIALAICYEISVPAHLVEAMRRGAELYLASVAKTPSGMETARATLADAARRHRLPIALVNCVGPCEGQEAGGGSLAINSTGRVLGALGPVDEALLIVDTTTADVETLALTS